MSTVREALGETPREATAPAAGALATESAEAQAALARRHRLVLTLRWGILAAILIGWEGAARLGLIDPFFFAMPSQVAMQLYEWIVDGTAQGPLWVQVLVTLEETGLGFLIGAVLGILG